MACIYIIKNKINGKQYVGKTIDFSRRMSEHKSESFNPNRQGYNYPIHAAIRKYGVENFIYEVLEDNIGIELLDDREKYYINKLDTMNKLKGYNICDGGQGGAIPSRQKKVYQYSLDGIYLQSYKSTREAEGLTGIDHSQIIRCCKLKSRQAGGYQWFYEYFESYPPVRHDGNLKPVKQISMSGEIIVTYSSIKEATQAVGLKSRTSIENVINGVQTTAAGYYWKLV